VGAALTNLVAADQALAQTAIADAIARGGNAKKIATAQGQFNSALTAAGNGNVSGAINLFRSAWATAQGA
jgi:hypothetical protein